MRLLLIAYVILMFGCQTRPAIQYEIPYAYRGWVEVSFGDPNCSPLTIRDRKQLIMLSRDGKACTSSPFLEGEAQDEYYAVGNDRKRLVRTGWGEGGDIWGNEYVRSGTRGKLRFFVGKEIDYNAWLKEADQTRS